MNYIFLNNNINDETENVTTALDLSIYSTKLSNQRIYLAYVRTGLVIAGVAGIYKHKMDSIFWIINDNWFNIPILCFK